MKKIKVIEKSGAFLEYQVEDSKVDSFILDIPKLGHGLAEQIIVIKDPETQVETTTIIPQEYTVEITDVVVDLLAECQAKRAAAYPPIEDYMDAKVKQASSDPTIVAEGLAQEQAYLAACLAVKLQFPKPV